MATQVNQPKRFDVLLGKAKAFQDDGGVARITCTASSDEIDLGVDRFMLSALETMRASFPGMTIFLNHKYLIPEDVFGIVTNATIVTRGEFHDLDLEITVDPNNERAMLVYRQIQSGAKLGVSVGVLVRDAEIVVEVVDGQKTKVLNIKDVETLEASIVGIPANRRSWVQGALKAASFYFEGEQRALLEKLADSVQTTNGGASMALENDENEDEITGETPADATAVAETPAEAETVAETPAEAEAVAETPIEPVAEVEEEETIPDDDDAEDEPDDDDDDGDEDESEEAEDDEAEDDDDEEDSSASVVEAATAPDADDGSDFTRAEVIQALRKKYSSADRDWFTIKAAKKPKPDEKNPDEEEKDGEEAPEERVAEILIYDAIGGGDYDDEGNYVNGAKAFVDAVAGIEADRINIRLNSPGGVITDGMAMRNALLRHGAKLYTYVDGIAASMASVVATAGECTMEPGSMMMIHEPWGCAMGNATDMAREARVLNRYGDNIARIYAKKAGKGTTEEWRDVMRDEGWYGPEEAVEAGLADHVGNGTDSETKVKSAMFDDRFLSLFKAVPDSAKGFFVKSAAEPTKTADISGVGELSTAVGKLTKALLVATNENDELHEQVIALKTQVADNVTEWANMDVFMRDFVADIEKLMDVPLQRKITPEAAFSNYAEKFPWLDGRIVASLARLRKDE